MDIVQMLREICCIRKNDETTVYCINGLEQRTPDGEKDHGGD